MPPLSYSKPYSVGHLSTHSKPSSANSSLEMKMKRLGQGLSDPSRDHCLGSPRSVSIPGKQPSQEHFGSESGSNRAEHQEDPWARATVELGSSRFIPLTAHVCIVARPQGDGSKSFPMNPNTPPRGRKEACGTC